MRIARSVASLGPVDIGDHVCWVLPRPGDLRRAARGYLSDGRDLGDKIMVVGPSAPAWREFRAPHALLVDPAAGGGVRWNADVLVSRVRQEAETADRQGYRALRVLAQMDHIWPADITAEQVADLELRLDAVTGGTAAVMVCAYESAGFAPKVLEQVASVHPHFAGDLALAPSFQMYSEAADCWNVSGVVDADGAGAFRVAVTGLLRHSATLRLRCDGLQLMDAVGMQTLAEAATGMPGRKIVLERANPTVRRCWELLGYDDPAVPAELVP